ncbi:hypothetical protein [Adhaeribacter aquaticus]|uniref:hypothetical protein n=1 Tax=Adhaeribacter aquaticus TaxID=299567 RepID=UPI00040163C9|nr:hypothetical protein [Adhaeribacter aquaticus]
MAKQITSSFNKILAFIYFIGFEVGIYFLLSYLLLNQRAESPSKAPVIVTNWNAFIYFTLLYLAITISTMLVLTSTLPRLYKPLIMQLFWWSWLGLVIMLLVAFN